jgi:hypothetical protein
VSISGRLDCRWSNKGGIVEYMMIVCGTPTGTVDLALVAETTAWVEEMNARGVRRFGSRLRPASSATTLRIGDGKVLASDGPFAETKEQILGFDLLDCADLDEALEVAGRHPSLKFGPIEVRPLWPS